MSCINDMHTGIGGGKERKREGREGGRERGREGKGRGEEILNNLTYPSQPKTYDNGCYGNDDKYCVGRQFIFVFQHGL